MKKFTNLLNEKKNFKYQYGCVMLELKLNNWDDILKEVIKDEDIHEVDGQYGLETEPHVTLLFGYGEDISVDDVKEILDDYIKPNIELKTISIFENEEYDVVKFEVKNDLIFQMNHVLAKLPHHSTFPDYNPHVTISYVKKGKGKDYVKELENAYIVECKKIVYSIPTGTDKKDIKDVLKW